MPERLHTLKSDRHRSRTPIGCVLVASLFLGACGGSAGRTAAPTAQTAAVTSVPPAVSQATSTTSVPAVTSTSIAPVGSAWHKIAPSPILAHAFAGTIWTGSEMLIWGGVSPESAAPGTPSGGGAAYNPATDTWRVISAGPKDLVGTGAPPVWNGTEAIFFVGNSPYGPVASAAYDPAKDTWRSFPLGPLGVRDEAMSAWTGTEMLIAGGVNGDMSAAPKAALLDPASGKWRSVPSLDALPGLMPSSIHWSGSAALISGGVAQCREFHDGVFNPSEAGCDQIRPFLAGLDPLNGRLDEFRVPEAVGDEVVAGALGWTGSELVFAGRATTGYTIDLFDPATSTWRSGRTLECAAVGRNDYIVTVPWIWTGSSLVVPCTGDHLAVYDPKSDSWRDVAVGRSPLAARSASSVVAIGDRIIVWGGYLRALAAPFNADGAVVSLAGVR